jgi:cytochrome c-type protein NapC
MTQADHSGATKFRGGKNCRGCHDGEQADIGTEILAGGHKLEAHPPAGKPGALHLFVRTAHDADRLYFQFRWKPGPAKNPARGDTAARVTVMLDDGGIKESARAGCWASCHDDAIGMASAAPGSKVTKYLGGSRVKLTRQGGGTQLKPDADLKALLAQGAYLEYWQARLTPGKPATAVGGYILSDRARPATSGVTADAQFAGGQWVVTLSRPLKPAGAGQKALVAGKPYAIGFAVHDDYTEHRHHYVSLEYTLQLDGGTADFVATGK